MENTPITGKKEKDTMNNLEHETRLVTFYNLEYGTPDEDGQYLVGIRKGDAYFSLSRAIWRRGAFDANNVYCWAYIPQMPRFQLDEPKEKPKAKKKVKGVPLKTVKAKSEAAAKSKAKPTTKVQMGK